MDSLRPLWMAGRNPQDYAARYEHGNCGLVAFFSRNPQPSRAALDRALAALRSLHHRSGCVDGEGDGCGVLTDIPRRLWARRLQAAGHDPKLAWSPAFGVAHLFVPPQAGRELLRRMEPVLARWGVEVLAARVEEVDPAALGPRARQNRPQFWQLALRVKPPVSSDQWEPFLWDLEGDVSLEAAPARLVASVGSRLFEVAMALEARLPEVHVLSCSAHTAVYKVRGDVDALVGYYPDLGNPDFETRAVIGHNRYSTNTTPTFERAQPFSLLAHNGEINTIRRLCMEAQALGIPIVQGGSDSQNLNRTLDALIHRFGFSLPEAMEILFPPIINEVKRYPPEWQDLYMYFRQAWGPFAQGPAAVFARHRHDAVMSVDALGLRPLWYVPAEHFVVMASEPGVVPTGELLDDPKPLSPGEKLGIHLTPQGVEVVEYPELQARVVERWQRRVGHPEGWRRFILAARAEAVPAAGSARDAIPEGAAEASGEGRAPASNGNGAGQGSQEEALRRLMEVWAWQNEDVEILESMAATGAEPIGSLGYDAPLAALSPELHNLADFFKETVAVVTNPAIDREREIEHFSTRVVVGARPPLVGRDSRREGGVVELRVPIVIGGWPAGSSALSLDDCRRVAAEWDTLAWEDLNALLSAVVIPMRQRASDGSLPRALARLAREACEAASSGRRLVVLDDGGVFADEEGSWVDPHLAVAAVDRALRRAAGLRRRVGIVVRSGALRNLHDVVVCLGLGADAVCPWMMLEQAARAAQRSGRSAAEGASRLCSALQKGMEKVISTLGIHELRGYARLFSAIGLKPELLEVLEIEGYAGSQAAGVGFAELEQDVRRRRELLAQPKGGGLVRPFRYYPRIWKMLGQAARGEIPYSDVAARMDSLERDNPVALRHVLDLRVVEREGRGPAVDPREVDISIGEHSMPFVIASMSFGSQGEAAYRAYLEAARQANIVCLNGEGGEIPDLVGRYPRHRGIQVASGRFGVHAEMLNGAWVIEIKIGQGAKPGEGGHLPGKKVSAKVARARNARVGIDLISPSNNHDIYSIEDLAQLIDELKTISPHSRIAVKVPVVPGIGTIAVGIAKAGADIINLSGFDGGTGAARMHALRHVGLPAELGVVESHRALVAAGIRDRVELWADGGMRNAADVLKMVLLGANRVGFGTLAMVAVGCTICRGCQLDTCHVGIATQIETVEEAMRRGLKRFVPREVDLAASHLATLLVQMGEALRELTARLGARRTQDLVGRSDLLEQARMRDRVDLSELLVPAAQAVA
ncbi:MAG TPA: glutamate synthase-related protein, partial [Limnochordales bacterium]